MNLTSPTRRARFLAGAGFHPYFTWEFISGGLTLAGGPDILTSVTILVCYGLK